MSIETKDVVPKDICRFCFKKKSMELICENCRLTDETYKDNEKALAVGTILKDEYVVGKILSGPTTYISYLGYRLSTKERVYIKEAFDSKDALRSIDGKSVVISDPEKTEKFKEHCDKIFEPYALFCGIDEPAIQRVYDVFYENGTRYAVMECLESERLYDYFGKQGRNATVAETLSIMKDVCRAIGCFESKNVVHTCFDFNNIVYDAKRGATVIGLNECLSRDGDLERCVFTCGEAFLPLEAVGENVSNVDNIYSLGVIAYWLLTGTLMPSAIERVAKLVDVADPDIPVDFKDVLEKCMALSFNNRYRSSRDVLFCLNVLDKDGYMRSRYYIPESKFVPERNIMPDLYGSPDSMAQRNVIIRAREEIPIVSNKKRFAKLLIPVSILGVILVVLIFIKLFMG